MTQSVRTQLRLIPRVYRDAMDEPRPFVHKSITPYEQNVSRTDKQTQSHLLTFNNNNYY